MCPTCTTMKERTSISTRADWLTETDWFHCAPHRQLYQQIFASAELTCLCFRHDTAMNGAKLSQSHMYMLFIYKSRVCLCFYYMLLPSLYLLFVIPNVWAATVPMVYRLFCWYNLVTIFDVCGSFGIVFYTLWVISALYGSRLIIVTLSSRKLAKL